MFKKLIATLVASLSFAAPVSATVNPGTGALLSAVHSHHQFTVHHNTSLCKRGMDGSFRPYTGVMTICTDTTAWDDNDHDTVRHETWHVIQHCLREDHHTKLQPVITPGTQMWRTHVIAQLHPEMIQFILAEYPETHHAVELEAFAMAGALTSSQVHQLFNKACY